MAISSEKTVFEIEQGDSQRIKARLADFDGKLRADLRVFFLGDRNDWLPTKRGINLPIDQIDQLREAVESLAAAAEQMTPAESSS